MDMNVRSIGSGDRATGSAKRQGTVLGRTAAAGAGNGGAPASVQPPDRPAPSLPAKASASMAWDAGVSGYWPMQAIASDMVEFAETLHRLLLGPCGDSSRPTPAIDRMPDKVRELEQGLITLLAQNGIERRDPIGSAFDRRCHQKIAERRVSACIPGTVVQTLSSAWTDRKSVV